jgi:hypothetical protein
MKQWKLTEGKNVVQTENSSINYSVFDIVTDKLTFHTPTDEEIQKAMNNVGLGGLWMGPKKVLDFSDKM